MELEKQYCKFCMCPLAEGDQECPFCGRSLETEQPPHHLAPGTVLNKKFLVGAAIGEGGFGITYIGRDLSLDMRVAVKEYYPSGYVNRNCAASSAVTCSISGDKENFFEKGRERFLQEARILAKFSSEPGIVCVRDFFEENNTAYIVMEYLDGETLQSCIKRMGTLSPQEALELLQPVMQSLEKVHRQGLIHRDISPDNIMMVDGQVKLLDFGAARPMTSVSNRSMSVLLKPGYAPEEQYRTKGEQGPWTDVYALCATMYKCITGVTPDDSIQRSYSDELKTPSALGIAMPPAMEAALMKGLAVLRKDRYQSIQELLDGFAGAKAKSDAEGKTVAAGQAVNEDDVGTQYMGNRGEAQLTEDDIGTQYMDERDAGEPEPQEPPEKNAQQEPEPEPEKSAVPETGKQIAKVEEQRVAKQETKEKHIAPEEGQATKSKTPVQKPGAKIALAAGGLAVAVVIVVFLLLGKMNQVSICGESYGKDTTSITISDTAVTAKDMAGIASLKELSYLSFNNCTLDNAAAAGLGKNAALFSLTLKTCSGFSDYSSISLLGEHLGILTISDCGLTNSQLAQISFSEMSGLSGVNLSQNPELSDVTPLSGAAGTLQELCVSSTAVVDFTPLGSCKKLTVLKAAETGMRSLSLPADTMLRELDISGNQIADLSPLGGRVDKLQKVSAADNQIPDLTPLSGCSQLTSLDVSRNQLASLAGLEQAILLEELEAAGNAITGIEGITNCAVLETVNLNGNAVSDISLLQKSAATLESLYLSGNRIADISPLAHTAALEHLNLDGNAVTSLEPLAESASLRSLSADCNQIVSAAGLENAVQLEYIYLAHNKLEDMSPIAAMMENAERVTRVLDLSWNNLQTLELPPKGSEPHAIETFALCGNSLSSLAEIKKVSGTHLLFSYADGMDLADLTDAYYRFSVLDCPLDKQVATKDALSNAAFTTDEEASEMMWSTRELGVNVSGGAERVTGPVQAAASAGSLGEGAFPVVYDSDFENFSVYPNLTRGQGEKMNQLLFGEDIPQDLPKEAVDLSSLQRDQIWNDLLVPLAADQYADVTLYGVVNAGWLSEVTQQGSEVIGNIDGMDEYMLLLRCGDKITEQYICWSKNAWNMENPWLAVDDFDADGANEVAVCTYATSGTGASYHQLWIYDIADDKSYIPEFTNLDLTAAADWSSGEVTLSDGRLSATTAIEEIVIDDPELRSLSYGNLVDFDYDADRYRAELQFSTAVVWGGPGGFACADATAPVIYADGEYKLGALTNISLYD